MWLENLADFDKDNVWALLLRNKRLCESLNVSCKHTHTRMRISNERTRERAKKAKFSGTCPRLMTPTNIVNVWTLFLHNTRLCESLKCLLNTHSNQSFKGNFLEFKFLGNMSRNSYIISKSRNKVCITCLSGMTWAYYFLGKDPNVFLESRKSATSQYYLPPLVTIIQSTLRWMSSGQFTVSLEADSAQNSLVWWASVCASSSWVMICSHLRIAFFSTSMCSGICK